MQTAHKTYTIDKINGANLAHVVKVMIVESDVLQVGTGFS